MPGRRLTTAGAFSSLGRSDKCFAGRIAFLTRFLWRFAFFTALVDIGVKTFFHRQFHLLSDALARVAGPLALRTTPRIRAQNDALRPLSALVFGLGAGALSLLPVARLYLALPLAVNPAPRLTGNFSPRPIDRDTPFLAINNSKPQVAAIR